MKPIPRLSAWRPPRECWRLVAERRAVAEAGALRAENRRNL